MSASMFISSILGWGSVASTIMNSNECLAGVFFLRLVSEGFVIIADITIIVYRKKIDTRIDMLLNMLQHAQLLDKEKY